MCPSRVDSSNFTPLLKAPAVPTCCEKQAGIPLNVQRRSGVRDSNPGPPNSQYRYETGGWKERHCRRRKFQPSYVEQVAEHVRNYRPLCDGDISEEPSKNVITVRLILPEI
jgi:hypothetical protein